MIWGQFPTRPSVIQWPLQTCMCLVSRVCSAARGRSLKELQNNRSSGSTLVKRGGYFLSPTGLKGAETTSFTPGKQRHHTHTHRVGKGTITTHHWSGKLTKWSQGQGYSNFQSVHVSFIHCVFISFTGENIWTLLWLQCFSFFNCWMLHHDLHLVAYCVCLPTWCHGMVYESLPLLRSFRVSFHTFYAFNVSFYVSTFYDMKETSTSDFCHVTYVVLETLFFHSNKTLSLTLILFQINGHLSAHDFELQV